MPLVSLFVPCFFALLKVFLNAKVNVFHFTVGTHLATNQKLEVVEPSDEPEAEAKVEGASSN
mgnify:CR=1 FL=1